MILKTLLLLNKQILKTIGVFTVIPVIFLLCTQPIKLFSQTADNVGPGRALYFNGIAGSVDFGDVYNDLYFPFTISCWVRIDSDASGFSHLFATEEGSDAYNGFWLRVRKDQIGLAWGDGRGGNNPSFRRTKLKNVEDISGRWVHISCVAHSEENIELFLNGIAIGGMFTGTSNQSMAYNTDDKVKIGEFYGNGSTSRMKGWIDELRVWNHSRTLTEIRGDMCRRLNGNETGLIGYWTFNQTSSSIAKDFSKSELDGNVSNSVARDFSGAPIGDNSTFSYSTIAGIYLNKNTDTITVTNKSAGIEGIHIYSVNSEPSRDNISGSHRPYYFGVFSSTQTASPETYDILISGSCSYAKRSSNGNANWTEHSLSSDHMVKNETQRGEYLLTSNQGSLNIDLGLDKVLCDQSQYIISPAINGEFNSVQWQDGSSSQNFVATKTGTYWLEIRSECQVTRDSISLIFANRPPTIDLGENKFICRGDEITLKTQGLVDDYNHNWSTGGKTDSIRISKSGIYILTISNDCGSSTDSLEVSIKEPQDLFVPNVITPNEDQYNEVFVVGNDSTEKSLLIYNRWGTRVYSDNSYKNNWSGVGLVSGVYFYRLIDNCSGQEFKGTLNILK